MKSRIVNTHFYLLRLKQLTSMKVFSVMPLTYFTGLRPKRQRAGGDPVGYGYVFLILSVYHFQSVGVSLRASVVLETQVG